MSIHKTDKKKWQVRWRDEEGRNRAVTCTSFATAQIVEDGVRNAKRQGESTDPDRGNMKLKDFYAEKFIPMKSSVAAGTRANYRTRWLPNPKPNVRQPMAPAVWHVGHKFGNWKLRDVNHAEPVLLWHHEMREAGATDAQMYAAHSLLMNLVTHAVMIDYLSRNRLLGHLPGYQPEPVEDPWLPSEIELIRNHFLTRAERSTPRSAEAFRRRRDAAFVSLMGYAAVRPGEALKLAWPRVLDLDRRSVGTAVEIRDTARKTDALDKRRRTKTKRNRSVPLEAHLRDDLREWWIYSGRPTTGLVFPTAPGSAATFSIHSWNGRHWQKALEAVGLDYKPPKHLRHSCVSMWIRERLDRGQVAERAGHSMSVCERTYIHTFNSLAGSQPFDLTAAVEAARRPDVRELFAV